MTRGKPPENRGRRAGPAWTDERASERGNLPVLQGFAEARAERVYSEAETCEACARARAEEGRADALCEEHLGQALGIEGGWDLGAPGKKL